ncbi:amidase domain-containing protein [Bacillus sp. NPDC077027]|uniref:amidase domain-containing protein n=1 Tax=Bacillus sp. NPDC077027 TaxID=3390548 RepID=UPI003CFFCFEC
MKQILQQTLEDRLNYLLNGSTTMRQYKLVSDAEAIERKKELFAKRNVTIVKAKARTKLLHSAIEDDGTQHVKYLVHLEYVCKDQDDAFYLEEQVEEREAFIYDEMLVRDHIVQKDALEEESVLDRFQDTEHFGRAFHYDRLAAVQYAETYWNKRNPAYKNFEDNCTNFISQCLKAGNAPTRGYPNRGSGWWVRPHTWSYSWTVAHSMKTYLTSSKAGLRAKQMKEASELSVGDVICYDFEGDGRFNHTTIVVAHDKSGMPLVNAQTYDSRMRYWSYEDSTAYTPSIRYVFFHILDDAAKDG